MVTKIYCPEDCKIRGMKCPIGIKCPPILTRDSENEICKYYKNVKDKKRRANEKEMEITLTGN